MNVIRLFFEVAGAITVLISIILFIVAIICWSLGIFPLLFRLGFASVVYLK